MRELRVGLDGNCIKYSLLGGFHDLEDITCRTKVVVLPTYYDSPVNSVAVLNSREL